MAGEARREMLFIDKDDRANMRPYRSRQWSLKCMLLGDFPLSETDPSQHRTNVNVMNCPSTNSMFSVAARARQAIRGVDISTASDGRKAAGNSCDKQKHV